MIGARNRHHRPSPSLQPPAPWRLLASTFRPESRGSTATSTPRLPLRDAANKPVFLYWGAEWCPPCAQIKSTIFNKREFQERSRLFVPVYLDGDTPSAQKHGEHFGVIGYPTMILFRPDGTEITRLPGGVDVSRYATVLDVALAEARPVAEILAAARSGGAVTDNDWRLLAFYSWGTDNGRVLPEGQRLATFRTVAARCPATLPGECARLFFEYLGAAVADVGTEGPSARWARPRRRTQAGADAAAGAVRAGRQRRQPAVRFEGRHRSSIRRGHPRTHAADDRLARGAGSSLGATGSAAALSAPEQLLLLRARVQLAKLDAPDAPLPAPLLDEAGRPLRRWMRRRPTRIQRQAAVNAAANLYWEAGLDEDANRLLTAELQKSKSPYYFMLDLADLAEKAGRKQEAVQWLERAYAGAKGPATRFQWGYNYLVGPAGNDA